MSAHNNFKALNCFDCCNREISKSKNDGVTTNQNNDGVNDDDDDDDDDEGSYPTIKLINYAHNIKDNIIRTPEKILKDQSRELVRGRTFQKLLFLQMKRNLSLC